MFFYAGDVVEIDKIGVMDATEAFVGEGGFNFLEKVRGQNRFILTKKDMSIPAVSLTIQNIILVDDPDTLAFAYRDLH